MEQHNPGDDLSPESRVPLQFDKDDLSVPPLFSDGLLQPSLNCFKKDQS